MKTCPKCKEKKPFDEFSKHKRDGYRSRCKPCEKEDRKEYRKDTFHLRQEYNKRPDVVERAKKRHKEKYKPVEKLRSKIEQLERNKKMSAASKMRNYYKMTDYAIRNAYPNLPVELYDAKRLLLKITRTIKQKQL